MTTVHFIDDLFDPKSHRTEEHADVLKALQAKWTKLPTTILIYHQQVDADHNVTPSTVEEAERLMTMPGPFYVVNVPGTPLEFFTYAAIFTTAYVLVKVSNLPRLNTRAFNNESPNNALGERENQLRFGGRIPDIFGTVIAVPDLIAPTYFTYVNHKKTEHAELCVGRGEYQFELVQSATPEIRDGDTLVAEIDGAQVTVYPPFWSSNSVGPPSGTTESNIIRIGGDITDPMRTAKRVSAVNGQTLEPPNAGEVTYDTQVGPVRDFQLIADPASSIDFTTNVTAGNYVTFSCKKLPIGAYVDDYSYGTAGNQAYGPFTGKYIEGGYIEIDVNPWSYYQFDNIVSVDVFASVVLGSVIDVDFYILIASVSTRIRARWSVLGVTTVSGKARIQFYDPWLVSPALTGYVGTSESLELYLQQRYDTVDFSGRFLVSSVTAKTITLDATQVLSANINWYYRHSLPTNWAGLIDSGGLFYTLLDNFTFDATGGDTKWIGPFTVNLPDMGGVVANFLAPQGLYKDTGSSQTAINVDVELELTPVDVTGAAVGASVLIPMTVEGSAESRAERAASIINDALPVASYYRIRARRTTTRHTITSGVVSDEVKWVDLYGTKLISVTDFGNVTTMRAVTTATTGAVAVKNRKLTARVTRRVKTLNSSGVLSSGLFASRRFCDILAHICFDEYLGNRVTAEVDLQNFIDVYTDVTQYFGTEIVGEFSHTFDGLSTSFEEMVSTVASACYCTVYRDGRQIKVYFDDPNAPSRILFNHRNKFPGSEIRTYEFGTEGDFDGIDFEFVNPTDGVRTLYKIPTDGSAIRPKLIKSVGIANRLQAYFHAWREWNRMLYKRVSVEFRATQEAELIIPMHRILCADNTRQSVYDGEVRSKSGTTIELSQPVTFVAGAHTIFLQSANGTVESMPVTAGADAYHVVLDHEPTLAMSLDPANYALTTYLIVVNTEEIPRDFIVVEREPGEGLTSTVTAYNFDARYYTKDLDYLNGGIDVNADPIS